MKVNYYTSSTLNPSQRKWSYLTIEPGEHTPFVRYIPVKNKVQVKGNSDRSHAAQTFEELRKIILLHAKVSRKLTLEFQFHKINSSAVKFMIDTLKAVEKVSKQGLKVKVNWIHDRSDICMYQIGLDIRSLYTVDFSIKPYFSKSELSSLYSLRDAA